MARSVGSAQCESVASYMDGVLVKIAEAYKPPKKLVLPAAYYTKLPDVAKYAYDSSLDKSVLEKMKAWRKARISYTEARKARIEEKQKKETEKSPTTSSPTPDATLLPTKVAPSSETLFKSHSIASSANDMQNHVEVNELLSYFSNETSSPFHNEHLNNLDVMEELSQVLQQPTTSQWGPTPILNRTMDQSLNHTLDHIDEIREEKRIPKDFVKDTESVTNTSTDPRHQMISLIVQELQKELDKPSAENQQSWPDLGSSVVGKKAEFSLRRAISVDQNELARALADLSIENQQLAKNLSDMGFPLSRVAHAIHDLEGQDNKKIVDYLLAIQFLEDLGMSEEAAVKALSLTQYDKHKAKVYYESLCTLRALGFPEDKASMALLKCNIDRDSALELLIA